MIQVVSVLLGAIVGSVLGFWSSTRQTLFERRIEYVEQFLKQAYETIGDILKARNRTLSDEDKNRLRERSARLSILGTLASLYLSESVASKIETYTRDFRSALTNQLDPTYPGGNAPTYVELHDRLNGDDGLVRQLEIELKQHSGNVWCRLLRLLCQ